MNRRPLDRLLFVLMVMLPGVASAQSVHGDIGPAAQVEAATAWQACLGQADAERLACFDTWAREQQKLMAAIEARTRAAETALARNQTPSAQAAATRDAVAAALASLEPEAAADDEPQGAAGIVSVGLEQGCRDRQFSELSRFWELESGSSCPTFGLRAFHPSTLSVTMGDRINRQPVSANPENSAKRAIDYSKHETRLSLSVRTKLASGLLTPRGGTLRDSLWAAYTQQSYWQAFNGSLSRPFRNTDHMPELIYVYPTTLALPGGWMWRYSGLGLVHQSNGQSDPLSRSWNRVYLMAGFEKGPRLNLQLRLWNRLRETPHKDDNPDISRHIGRGDITLGWNIDAKNALRATYTGSFNKYGSGRLEWTHSLGDGWSNSVSGLRLYTALFHGYGDSLIDYNFRRTVFSVGLSLIDF